jgi:hypothetical protein
MQRATDAITHGTVEPTVTLCIAVLIGVKLSLRLLGFARTHDWVRKARPRSPIEERTNFAAASRIAERIAIVSAFYPGRARCLEQSLALGYFLRQRGMQPSLRLGYQQYRNVAHAWIELDGRPVNERGELLRKVIAFPEIAP